MPHDPKREADISTPSPEWKMMEAYRELPRDLRGDVLLLQEQASEHLWKASKEIDADWKRRVKALQFDPFYWSAAEHIGGQPYEREIAFSDDVPAQVLEWAKDIDGTGRDLTAFFRASSINAVGYGVDYLLALWDADAGRPYIMQLPAESVLDPYEEGAPLRIQMTDYERDADKPWIRHEVETIWMLWDGEPTAGGIDRYARVEIYEHKERRDPESEWRKEPSSVFSLSPHETLPLVSNYTGSNSPMEQVPWVVLPPNYALAVANRVWLNKRSDLDFGLHIGNIPQRAASGIGEEEMARLVAGYSGMLYTEKENGRFYYVEHSGASFGISFQDLGEMERRMQVMGSMPNVTRASTQGAMTATAELRDMGPALTRARAWAYGWQDTCTSILRKCAQYQRISDKFTSAVFTDFGPQDKDADRAAMIQKDYISGDLEPDLYFPEMQRLGVYSQAFDVDAAVAGAKRRRAEAMRSFSDIPAPRNGKPDPSVDPPEEDPQ